MAKHTKAGVIAGMINYVDEKDRPCAFLVLMHQNGNRQVEIQKYQVTAAQTPDPEVIWKMFHDRAEAHSQELPGAQYYNILAFCEDSQEPFTQQSFKLAGESDSYGLASEGPTTTGIVQQMMRHREAEARHNHLHQEAVMDKMVGMIGLVLAQNEKLMEKNIDVLELSEKLLMERASDVFDKQIKLREHDRNSKWMDQAMQLGPSLINQLTGKKVFTENAEDTSIVNAFIDSLSPEQVKMMAGSGMIPNEVVGAFMQRAERRQKEKNEARKLAQNASVEAELGEDENKPA